MFLGHPAVGMAVKQQVPRASFGTCLLACQLADLIWHRHRAPRQVPAVSHG